MRRRTILAGVATLAASGLVLLFKTTPGQALVRIYAPALASRPAAVEKQRPADLPPSEFLAESEVIPWVDPGLAVGSAPPRGWSHLVVKNNVRVANAETTVAPKTDAGEGWNDLLGTYWLAILADVRKLNDQPKRFGLERIGMGWCREIDGRHVTLSSTTLHTQKVELSTMESILLAMQELTCEQHMFIRARSLCTLFYDVERYMLLDDRHIQGQLRHALLAHPQTGQFAAFYWQVPPTSVARPTKLTVDQLPPNFVTTYDLHYQPGSGRLKSMPSESDYATMGLPECPQRYDVAPEHVATFLSQNVTVTVARELETELRTYLGWHVEEK